jgi:hypothetical protein
VPFTLTAYVALARTWASHLGYFLRRLSTCTCWCLCVSQEGLLLTDAHVVLKTFRLPYMMALMSEILVILSGLLMFGITGSRLILILAFFVPFLAVLGLRAWSQWVKNDYELLQHPSLRPQPSAAKVCCFCMHCV